MPHNMEPKPRNGQSLGLEAKVNSLSISVLLSKVIELFHANEKKNEKEYKPIPMTLSLLTSLSHD